MATLEQQARRALAPLGRMTGDRRGVQAAVKSLAKEVRKAAAETPPKPLATHLVRTGVAAWAVAPDGGKEVLVKRDSGDQLLDFQGNPFTRARSPSPSAGREYRVSYFNELEGLEGLFLDMYLDSKSNVTVGLGHRISSPEEATKLPFVKRGSSKPAHENHIENAYRKVQRQIDWRGYAHKYVGLTSIQVPRATVTTLAFDDIDQKLHEIGHFFPHFESYPLGAKLASWTWSTTPGSARLRATFRCSARPCAFGTGRRRRWSRTGPEWRTSATGWSATGSSRLLRRSPPSSGRGGG